VRPTMVGGSWRAQCDRSRAVRATLRSCSVAAAIPSAPSTATRVVSGTKTCRPVQSAYRVAIPYRFASSTSEGASSVMGPILLPVPGPRRGGRAPERESTACCAGGRPFDTFFLQLIQLGRVTHSTGRVGAAPLPFQTAIQKNVTGGRGGAYKKCQLSGAHRCRYRLPRCQLGDGRIRSTAWRGHCGCLTVIHVICALGLSPGVLTNRMVD
jgi:hypothetical protein